MFKALNKKLGRKGFTLIELIVVIAIIAILAVILLPRFTGFTKSANEKAAISDARNVLLAVQALQAQGTDTEITMADINTYAGYTASGSGFNGSIDPTSLDLTTGTFTYTVELNGSDYTVSISNYEILPTVSSAPHED